MKQHKLSLVALTALALALTFAPANDARAQAGDLDILSRTVPPIVMIQFDTSGSMRNVILPNKYITDRGAGSPTVWFNRVTNNTATPAGCVGAACYSTTSPASRLVSGAAPNNFTSVTSTSGSEDFRPNCQVFPNNATVARNQSLCFPGITGCTDDAADDSSPQSGAVLKCWNLPAGCANVPASLTCTTTTRARNRTSGGALSSAYTVITFPDVSFTSSTDFPVNYIWWLAQELYLGRTPVDYINQDRNGGAKQAIADVVNSINLDGYPAKVKFGLARYSENTGDDNGGYVVVEPDLNNKALILSTLANLPASGYTPLSETLVDVGRYLAGADRISPYPAYARNLSGGSTAPIPPSPVTSSCEKLFVIAVTDGLPTDDSNNHYPTAGSTTTFNSAFGSYADPNHPGNLVQVAKGLYSKDLRSTLSGQQNVSTYTVGFSLDSTLLFDAAAAGNGVYYSTNNADELADSLVGAIQDIIQKNTTLSSATVPASRSAFDNGFYTAYFLPSGRKSVWPGHLEAYTMNSSLAVIDANGNPAIDPATDQFLDPRHPFWDVSATLIAGYNTRTLYTNKGGARVPLTAANLVDPNGTPTNLVPADLGLTAADMSLYPQPASHISITDPNKPTSLERLGDSIIEFARGADAFDEDADGSRTNVRPFVFGDVFHSSPLAIGAPLNSMRFETNYGPVSDSNSFMGRYLLRNRVLYVGANDGFLHAIAAGTYVDPTPTPGDEYYTQGDGHEIFGFVPGLILPKLKSLPREDIAKVYYVDGAPTAADAWIDYNGNGVKEGDDWTTVMLVPLREGGEGMTALDVTNPSATSGNHGSYPRFMWEFTDPGLGQTWSRPIITRVKVRGGFGTGDKCGANDGDGDCVETWVAIFGAGYRNESNPNMGVYISDPNNATAKKGRGVYIVRISDGSILAHLQQDPNTSAPLNKMAYAITAEPAVLDLDGDGFAELVYIGDVGGQMWKWDLSAVGVLTSGKVPTSVWPADILFQAPVATIAAGAQHYHSIFQGAAAAYLKGILSLSFGSGERADLGYVGTPAADPNDLIGLHDDNNRFWVVLDRNPSGAGAFPSTLPIYETATTGHQNLTDVTFTATDSVPSDAGYFFRVPDGQKFITDHIVFSGQVFSLTYMPDAAGAGVGGNCALGGTTIQWAWTLSSGVGVLDDPTTPTVKVRNATLSNGAPTNPRITVARGPDGRLKVKVTVQTSTGAQPNPSATPAAPNPVQPIFWRQVF